MAHGALRLPQVQELVAFEALQPTRRAESWARIAFGLESQPSIPLDGASHRAKQDRKSVV